MASEVKLPRLGQGMESGTIVKWLKAVGDDVALGEPLYELDTEKVTQEVEAEVAGTLLRIAVEAGEVPVGQTIAVIGDAGEEVPAEAAKEEAPASAVPAPAAEGDRHRDESATTAPQVPSEPASPQASSQIRDGASHRDESATKGDRIKASPLARRKARERGIELSALTGTGPDGRIVAEDVERVEAAPAGPAARPAAAGEVESVPLTSVRKTIARRLTAAGQVPTFELTLSADMTQADALIERARELYPDVRITVTDLIAKLCARALERHPDVNVQFGDEALLRFATVDIGLAVAAPQGLVVPVIRSVERLSLAGFAERRAEVVGRARDGKLKQEDLEGGTFTISNLGMYGIEQFVAILNPPQAAILAVGTTEDRPVVRDGEIVVRPMLTVTLTVDHRAVDGAPAADFLRTLKVLLEEPALGL